MTLIPSLSSISPFPSHPPSFHSSLDSVSPSQVTLYFREVSENFTSAFFFLFPVNFSSKHLDFGLAFYEDHHVACYATTFCFVELCYDSWGWGFMISVFPSAFFLGFNDSTHPLSSAEGTTVWVTTYKFRVNIYLAYMALFSMSPMAVWYRGKSESWEHQSHIVYVQWEMLIRKPARRQRFVDMH